MPQLQQSMNKEFLFQKVGVYLHVHSEVTFHLKRTMKYGFGLGHTAWIVRGWDDQDTWPPI